MEVLFEDTSETFFSSPEGVQLILVPSEQLH